MELNSVMRYSIIEKGCLVRAASQPIDRREKKVDIECLGVVQEVNGSTVIVSWPNEGLLTFRYLDLESVDN